MIPALSLCWMLKQMKKHCFLNFRNMETSIPEKKQLIWSVVKYEDTGLVTRLINVGSGVKDLNIKLTALVAAEAEGKTGILQYLINGTNVEITDIPIIIASYNGDTDALQSLVTEGACVNNAKFDSETLLMIAAQNCQTKCMNYLIELGADVNAADKHGQTALIRETYFDHLPNVKALIEAGADVNTQDKNSNTALMMAASTGNVACLEELIQAGANVNSANNFGETGVSFAAMNDHRRCIMRLIDAGADVITPMAKMSSTAVPALIKSIVHHENMDYIIQALDSDVFIDNSHIKDKALMVAAEAGKLSIVKYLIRKGAAVNASNSQNGECEDTVLMLAAEKWTC